MCRGCLVVTSCDSEHFVEVDNCFDFLGWFQFRVCLGISTWSKVSTVSKGTAL